MECIGKVVQEVVKVMYFNPFRTSFGFVDSCSRVMFVNILIQDST